jgi:branched-chain amino acid transport system substrate-binding protein
MLAVSACGGDDSEATPAEPAPAEPAEPSGEPVKIGTLKGVTGDYAAFTPSSLASEQLAIEEINAAGGIQGRPVELIVADNESTAEGAVTGFDKLVEIDGVIAVGGVESDGAVAIVDTAIEQEIPVMCPGCGTSELDDIGGYMWRITASDTDFGTIMAQWARDNGIQKVALLVQQTAGTVSPAEAFSAIFTEKIGGEVCAEVGFDPGAPSYAAEVQEAWSCDPEAVYISAGFEAGVPIVREWDRRGYGGTLLLAPDMLVPEILEAAPALEGGTAISIGNGYAETTPAYDNYAAILAERGTELTEPSAAFYDANMFDQYIALGLAAAAADELTGPAIAAKVVEVTSPPGTVVYTFAEGVAELLAGNDIDLQGASSSLDLTDNGQLVAPTFSVIGGVDGDWATIASIELDPTLKD